MADSVAINDRGDLVQGTITLCEHTQFREDLGRCSRFGPFGSGFLFHLVGYELCDLAIVA